MSEEESFNYRNTEQTETRMALFTIDDLDYLENGEENFFGRSGNVKQDCPSERSIDTILNYSRVLSIRRSKHIDELRMILN
jgi:hypothetical protein